MAQRSMMTRLCVLLAAVAIARCDSLEEDDERFNDLSFLAHASSELEALTALDAHFSCNVTVSPAHEKAGRTPGDACSNGGSGGGIDRDGGREAVELVMSHGWWDAALRLIDAAGRDGVDLSAAVHASASKIRGKLQSLVEALGSSGRKSTGIQPAFEWAQSPEAVYLQVKFAHRLDAPATLGCEAEHVKFSVRALEMRAECREKNKAFTLSLSLLRTIDGGNSTWSMTSVGRATVTLVKAAPGVWPRLLHSTQKAANMHTWWAMKEKYERENEDFIKALKANATAALNATRSATPTPTATQLVQGSSRAAMADAAVDVSGGAAAAAADSDEKGY